MIPTAEQFADKFLSYITARMNVTTGTRDDLHKFFVRELDPVVPSAQKSLTFEDSEALKGHCEEIIGLLKKRRSAGCTNAELAEISLKYTSRISDLRAAGWRISCNRVSGRTYKYMLSPEMW